MGRKPVPKPPAWLEHKIDEINAMPPNFNEEWEWRGHRSLLADRSNLLRLIELISISDEYPITHFLLDPVRVTIMPTGLLVLDEELDSPGLISRIISEDVPVDRLRVCPSCDRIFWKQTSRSQTCGEPSCAEKQSRRKKKQKKKEGK